MAATWLGDRRTEPSFHGSRSNREMAPAGLSREPRAAKNPKAAPPWPLKAPRSDVFALVLISLFIAGIHLGAAVPISDKIPLPSALAGLAGLIMLWRYRDSIQPTHLAAFLFVV